MNLRCSMAGGSSSGGSSQGRTPCDGPKAYASRGAPLSQKPLSPSVLRATMMFNPKPATVNYIPSWQQVLRAVQQCYMPALRGAHGARTHSPAPSVQTTSHTDRPSLVEYYQDFLASDDEGGWERVLQQASLTQQLALDSSSFATYNTYGSSFTSIEEPHGDPQDDELFCMRADLAPTAARLRAAGLRPSQANDKRASSPPHQASRSTYPPLPDLSGMSELEQQRARLRHAVQLIRDPNAWQDVQPPSQPRSPSPLDHRAAWSPAAGSMSLSSLDDVPSAAGQGMRLGMLGSPSLSSQLDDGQPTTAASSATPESTGWHTPAAAASSKAASIDRPHSPGRLYHGAQTHDSSGSTKPHAEAAGASTQLPSDGHASDEAPCSTSQQSEDGGCVFLPSDLGVVERHDDFVDHVELEEVMHQLRTTEAGAPANHVMPAEKTEVNVPDPDGEGPPASASDIITGGKA